MLINRVADARGYLERCGVDALLFLNLSNIRYLSGFTGSDGALVIFRDESCFLTDSRYSTQAMSEVRDFRTIVYQEKKQGIFSLFGEKGIQKAGFEADNMSVAFYKALSEMMPAVELFPIGSELNTLRIIKDAEEILCIGKAAEIASDALRSIFETLRPDITERTVALDLEYSMLKAGAEDKAFDFIVASGQRGALPHGKASDKKIRAGELITIDFGAVYQGYNSDETVTVVLGEPDGRQREIYQLVKDAHDIALAAVKPGISFRELDSKARDYIENRGYGEYFGHGLGHGVGLDIHETPVISFRSEGQVQEGMVFTIEPGIYLPGWGGVRIEDTVCVTGDGCRVLTKLPKDLLIL